MSEVFHSLVNLYSITYWRSAPHANNSTATHGQLARSWSNATVLFGQLVQRKEAMEETQEEEWWCNRWENIGRLRRTLLITCTRRVTWWVRYQIVTHEVEVARGIDSYEEVVRGEGGWFLWGGAKGENGVDCITRLLTTVVRLVERYPRKWLFSSLQQFKIYTRSFEESLYQNLLFRSVRSAPYKVCGIGQIIMNIAKEGDVVYC